MEKRIEEEMTKYWAIIDLVLKVILSGILDKPNDVKGYNKKKREEKELFSPPLFHLLSEKLLMQTPKSEMFILTEMGLESEMFILIERC